MKRAANMHPRVFGASGLRGRMRRAVWTIAFLAVLQGVAIASGVCTGGLETYLDEGLRRALYTLYEDFKGEPQDVVPCETIVEELRSTEELAPSLIPRAIEDALVSREARHHRWYILTNQVVEPPESDLDPRSPEATSGDAEDLESVQAHLEGVGFRDEALMIDHDAGVLLVHAQSMHAFSELVSDSVRTRITHVMENYPFSPALGPASAEIGLDRWRRDDLGDRYAIAVIDTGVDNEHFQDRIVYEACFSSHRYAITSEDETYTTCNDLANELHPEWLPDSYVADSAFGRYGGACKDYQPTGCDHGSNVAYVAAGDGQDGAPRGVVPRAGIVAIQAASILPAEYCHEDGDTSTCARLMPYDVLRGLQFLERALNAGKRLDATELRRLESKHSARGEPPETDWALLASHELVAVNLSFETNHSCQKVSDPDVAATCWEQSEGEESTDGPYEQPCYNVLSLAIEHLRMHSVYTVVAAGNKKPTPTWGGVSNPACAEFAIAVSSWKRAVRGLELYEGAKYSAPLVDFLAPGVSVEFGSKNLTGTSFAAPFVAGAIVLIRERLEACEPSAHDALWHLEQHRQAVDLQGAAPSTTSTLRNLGLFVDLDPCDAP